MAVQVQKVESDLVIVRRWIAMVSRGTYDEKVREVQLRLLRSREEALIKILQEHECNRER
jgi:hypothetical protein